MEMPYHLEISVYIDQLLSLLAEYLNEIAPKKKKNNWYFLTIYIQF